MSSSSSFSSSASSTSFLTFSVTFLVLELTADASPVFSHLQIDTIDDEDGQKRFHSIEEKSSIRSNIKSQRFFFFYLLRVGLGCILFRAYRFRLLCFVIVRGGSFHLNGGGCIVAGRHGVSFQRGRGSGQVACLPKCRIRFLCE